MYNKYGSSSPILMGSEDPSCQNRLMVRVMVWDLEWTQFMAWLSNAYSRMQYIIPYRRKFVLIYVLPFIIENIWFLVAVCKIRKAWEGPIE